MNEIKVSVIIPVYNVEEYIEECLDSVVNQTLKEIEIIIVNDGTQDNSMKRIERFLPDKRIIIINKENGGVSSARNTGMKIAKGEYISFIDPDDFIKLSMMEELYKDAEDADIVFSDFILYDNLDKNEKIEKIYEKKTRIGSMIWSNQLLKFRGVTSKLYKRTFLQENHILFIEKIIYEDTSFNFTAFIISNNVKYIKKFHYYYRQNRDGSTTTSPNKEKEIEAYKKIVIYLEKFMSRMENNDLKKTRIYLLMTYYKALSYKAQNIEISLLETREFEMKLKNVFEKKYSREEIEIIRVDVNEILKTIMYYKISLINKIYWKNKILTKKILRRIIEKKIKSSLKFINKL